MTTVRTNHFGYQPLIRILEKVTKFQDLILKLNVLNYTIIPLEWILLGGVLEHMPIMLSSWTINLKNVYAYIIIIVYFLNLCLKFYSCLSMVL